MKGLRALGLQGDWQMTTRQGTITAAGFDEEMPAQPVEGITAEVVVVGEGRALKLSGSMFGAGELVRMVGDEALQSHPLGLYLEGSDQMCPPGVVATLMGATHLSDPARTLTFAAILQVTEAENTINGVARTHQMGTGRTETRVFTLSR
ncbi:hypothetical protein [Aliiroseovarius subalbicans]|uniref:hypothetical protein n=1 Tax=Aliiroseovarius subalbicans TaxID=2925840 RepID=UPI001F5AC9A5|nr:hypothetical protein [Aliiroseovarius subalbicans]MCI2398715.1 hypothetical protein [Aliiroseovarius subalbicans]